MASAGPITLSIEELRLEGVPPHQRFAVAQALSQELGKLLTDRGLPTGLREGRSPVPPTVEPAGLGAADLGRSIASALYEGWR